MAVVIEELEVLTQPQPASAPAPAAGEGQGGNALDERALQAALGHEAWRVDRLAAD